MNRREGTDRRKSKTMDEVNFMNFIIKNLDEIISLFLTDKSANQNDLINEEILQALNFIFEGSIDDMQTILKFNFLLKQPLIQAKIVGFVLIYFFDIRSISPGQLTKKLIFYLKIYRMREKFTPNL